MKKPLRTYLRSISTCFKRIPDIIWASLKCHSTIENTVEVKKKKRILQIENEKISALILLRRKWQEILFIKLVFTPWKTHIFISSANVDLKTSENVLT